MEKKNKNILFQLVIHNPERKKEKKYTIFDQKPCFSNLTSKEKKTFLKNETQKVKSLITKEYKSRYSQKNQKAPPTLINNGA